MIRQTTVFTKTSHIKINISICCNITVFIGDDFLNESNHLWNVLRGTRLVIRFYKSKPGKIFVHQFGKSFSQGIVGFAILIGALDDLVVDVSNITHKIDFVTAPAQVTDDDIYGGISTSVTDVAKIVNGDAADVKVNFTWLNRFEFFFFACQRILNLYHFTTSLNALLRRCCIFFCPSISAIFAISGPSTRPVNAARSGINNFLPDTPSVCFISARTCLMSVPYLRTAVSASTKNCSPASRIAVLLVSSNSILS